jgi:hypothetical protein
MLDTLTMPQPVKMGGAEFPIRLVTEEDRKHTDQDGVGDGDNRTLLPPAGGYRYSGLLLEIYAACLSSKPLSSQ